MTHEIFQCFLSSWFCLAPPPKIITNHYTKIIVWDLIYTFRVGAFRINFKQKCTNVAFILFPYNRILFSYCFFTSFLNSKLVLLYFLLTHPNKQSDVNFSFVGNISDIARGLFFAATFIAQFLNCKSVLLF